ncbi:MAG: hypothetical protein ACOH2M_01320 [Cypionkella sp.]
MRTVFAAIARAFAAAATSLSTVWSYCKDTGKWIAKTVATTVGSIGGGGSAPAASPLQELEAAMAAEAARPGNVDDLVKAAADISLPPTQGGDGYDRIQRACCDINTGGKPAREDWQALSPLQRDWLQELTPSMRLLVGNIERDALVQHMRGGKGLRGVIRCDAGSVAAWQHANAIEAPVAGMDVNEAELAAPAPRIAI